MSIEISLRDKETDEEIMSLNWLRNPFGLERWAEDNLILYVGETAKLPEKKKLWYVCNNWNYENSDEIDRQLFKEVIDEYWMVLQKLEVGYFVFDLPEYRQFVEGVINGRKLEFENYRYQRDHTEIAIEMECFRNIPSLHGYKEWFYRLVLFAEKLQDPNVVFHCSN